MSNETPHSPRDDAQPRPKRRRQRISNRLLAADAWIDSSVFRFGFVLRRAIEAFSTWMRRFRVRGFKRLMAELASDAFTFGLGGIIIMLAFALPAFQETRKDDWRTTDDFSVTFLDRYGNEIGKRGILLNDTVPLEELPDYLVKAALATEDRRFFEHFGIDVIGTARAMMENLRARSVVQGGSSITQQLAKNLFLSNERTLERKIKEAFLSLWLEANLTKREILKLYLDRAYMGGGAFGVGAASEFYFGKSVRNLTLAESAMLAGLFKAPTKFAPHVNLPAARLRANEVLTNMVQADFMTEGQVIGARRNPATAIDRSKGQVPDHFLDWAFEEVKKIAPGNDRILTVRTSLDPGLQRQAEDAVQSTLRQHGEAYRVKQAAMVSVLPDGAVRAMVGGMDYGASQFNRATNALRQPGSSFKPFVYITAFMNGFSPDSIVPDRPLCIGNWCPRNYGRSYRGPVSLKLALTKSINTIPVRLAQAIGRKKIIATASAMGLTHQLEDVVTLPIGTSEVTVLDMAGAYSVFSNGGMKATPYAVLEIKNSAGTTIWSHARDVPPPERVLPLDKVEQMNDVLHNVVVAGTGRRAIIDGLTSAGKTGTTQAYRDAWFIGYTGNYTTAVWFGNDDYTPTGRVTGGSLPAMTWKTYMEYAHTGIDLLPLPGVGLEGDAKRIASTTKPDADGQSYGDRPRLLSQQSAEVIRGIGALLRNATPLPPAPSGQAALAAPAKDS
ncbi:PBP1A family penicillin-binding protein [Breoghania sp. L-A4]|uniref:transglycosylase domain-containing protein n=1 Tax=Breoghania sp. L-A4 TaxID=2304600 RepID=UPI000E35837B|nr:PBP1A family penicillin-binding protein [Breoghania sp. L-A4]AXS39951.1 PBP1A family penicillin-binding protein [Breoghania sp. L-A4]